MPLRLPYALPIAFALLTSSVHAQAPSAATTRKVLGADDYARWRTIDGAQLSSDGKWAVYGLRFTNTLPADAKPLLRLRDVTAGTEIEIVDASQASFSPDGKYLAYLVETQPRRTPPRGADSATTPPPPGTPATAAAATPARGATTITRRWELRELATGTVRAWRDIQSVRFSPTSTHLLLRRRPASAGTTGAAAGNGAAARPAANAPRGVDAILHTLGTDQALFLGSVGEAEFNVVGDHLAYTVDAAIRDANGVFVHALATGRTQALDNDSLRYSRLTWNDRGTGLAVLKGHEVATKRELTNRLLVFPTLAGEPAAVQLDPTATTGFPAGFVLTERATLEWSEDGRLVFLGIMPQTNAPDTARRRSTDSLADVDVWRTQDERIQSQQMIQAEAERNRTFRQAFDVTARRYITLTDSAMRELELPISGEWAVGRDPRPYISDYKSAAANIFRVNTRTGERVPMLTAQLTGQHLGGITPDGQHFLYFANAQWHAVQLATGTTRAMAAGAPSFVNREYDYPGPRPPYGIAGYTPDGRHAIVRARFDLWLLALDGAAPARNLTNGLGAREQIVFRPVQIAPIDSSVRRAARVEREIDLSKPVMLAAYGEWTKKAGFYTLTNGQLQSLVYDDAMYSTPVKARDADRVLFTRQTFTEFPDVRLSGSTLANAVKISDANPQHASTAGGGACCSTTPHAAA
jgi:hypothetical protein